MQTKWVQIARERFQLDYQEEILNGQGGSAEEQIAKEDGGFSLPGDLQAEAQQTRAL